MRYVGLIKKTELLKGIFMRALLVLTTSIAFIVLGCSKSENKGANLPKALGDNGAVDFDIEILASQCANNFSNPFNEPNYYDEELAGAIRTGDAPCVKKMLEMGWVDPNKPISGFFEREPTLPLWRALDDSSFFFSKPTPFATLKALVDGGMKLNVLNSDGDNPLHWALENIENDRYDSVTQYLIQTGQIDFGQADRDGVLPLNKIAKSENIITLDAILKQGVDVNQSGHGQPALFVSLQNGWEAGSLRLLKAGSRLDATDSNQNTPLHVSLTKNLWDFASQAIDQVEPASMNRQNLREETPLFLALSLKNELITKKLLGLGARVDLATSESTPLHAGVRWGHPEISKQVIAKAPADHLDRQDGGLQTPLSIATTAQAHDLMEQLLARGARPGVTIGQNLRTSLHIATAQDDRVAVSKLLKYQAPVNDIDGAGLSPLFLASSVTVMDLLMSKGADVGLVNSEGVSVAAYFLQTKSDDLFLKLTDGRPPLDWRSSREQTLLHIAAAKNRLSSARWLLDQGVDPNSVDDQGRTPLYSAVDKAMVLLLFSKAADLNWQDWKGTSVFASLLEKYFFDSSSRRLDLVKSLLDNGVDVNQRLSSGSHESTALILAHRNGGYEPFRGRWLEYSGLIQVLVDYGANVNDMNSNGETALFYVNSPEEVRFLRLNGADTDVTVNNKTAEDKFSEVQSTLNVELATLRSQVNELQDQLKEQGGTDPILIQRLQGAKAELDLHSRDVQRNLDIIAELAK